MLTEEGDGSNDMSWPLHLFNRSSAGANDLNYFISLDVDLEAGDVQWGFALLFRLKHVFLTVPFSDAHGAITRRKF
jgi:hypothetical protein